SRVPSASPTAHRAPRAAVPRAAARPHGVARRVPATGAYGVQLGAFRSGTHAAMRHWEVLVAHDARLLRGLHPRVSALRTKAGRLYRLQVRGLTDTRAALICRHLRARAEPCIVLRPHGH
ncbi:MAG: hypothetical protein KGL36_02725, partial [Gammaproteobacteria bacterium]|nr:hypothetical protein [Gammaproteobacteria bacterium]